ncbi:MAG: HD-GYP domain-containing protein, partial [Solirubrobacterales bacterium]|nr:HD-GYP domain-containing protein [Solirubrobacterales bacterium]
MFRPVRHTAVPRMEAKPTDPVRRLPQVAVATFTVVGCPIFAVFALRSSGAIVSPLLLVAVAVALSIVASHAGAAYWRNRRAAGDLLFGELMVWGWIGRRRLDRLIANAEALLGPGGAAAPGPKPGNRARLLERLSRSLEARDPHTHGHSRRVARHSSAIAERMGLPPEQVAKVRAAAAIHDVGKIVTPKEVIEKPGALTEEEYDLVKRHAAAGARMTVALGDEELTRIVRHHHERLDGNGYPDGLAGEEIPIGARVVAVADTFDALISTRPYRPAAAHKEALAVLGREAGAQLDPDAVRAFRRHYSEHPRVALWALLLNGSRQLLQPLVERLGLGGAASAAKATAVSLAVVAASGVAIQPGGAEAPRRVGDRSVPVERSSRLAALLPPRDRSR